MLYDNFLLCTKYCVECSEAAVRRICGKRKSNVDKKWKIAPEMWINASENSRIVDKVENDC